MSLKNKGRTKTIFLFIILLVSFYLVVPQVILARQHTQAARIAQKKPTVPTPTIKIQLSPTRIFAPTSTPTPTKIKPTITPTVTLTPTHIISPTGVLSPTSLSSLSTTLLDQVNQYRLSKGLSAVKSDSYTCSFASLRAGEIVNAFNHDGFSNRIASHTLPYPSYHEVTENIAMTTNSNDVVTMWINSSGHAANMQKDTPFVCIEKVGNYYAYEGWKP